MKEVEGKITIVISTPPTIRHPKTDITIMKDVDVVFVGKRALEIVDKRIGYKSLSINVLTRTKKEILLDTRGNIRAFLETVEDLDRAIERVNLEKKRVLADLRLGVRLCKRNTLTEVKFNIPTISSLLTYTPVISITTGITIDREDIEKQDSVFVRITNDRINFKRIHRHRITRTGEEVKFTLDRLGENSVLYLQTVNDLDTALSDVVLEINRIIANIYDEMEAAKKVGFFELNKISINNITERQIGG
jgi:uncharacterized protein YdbL (DUF1318 family)